MSWTGWERSTSWAEQTGRGGYPRGGVGAAVYGGTCALHTRIQVCAEPEGDGTHPRF